MSVVQSGFGSRFLSKDDGDKPKGFEKFFKKDGKEQKSEKEDKEKK